MNTGHQDDGWDSHEQEDHSTMPDLPSQLRYNHKEVARDILDQQHHSLQPDMVFGWRPKLPSCPLPLTYTNPYTDALLTHLSSDDRFKVVFLGPRPSNSVQLNQQYQYQWRYRSRYNSSIQVVRQAVKRVGDNGKRLRLDISSDEIAFDSSFESANLDIAIKIKKNQYDLFLRSDTNTRGHTSWYYFKVNNKNLTGEVQFNICNFGKKKNLYPGGLKPYEMRQGGEWKQDNCYEVNWVERICRYGFERKAFQLQFKYFFKEKNQSIYFAYSIPYTYTKLQAFITDSVTHHSKYVQTSKLCQTLGGLEIPLMTITNKHEGQQNSNLISNCGEIKKKKIVLISGRIHPGQPNSSYLIEGLVRALLTEQPYTQALRQNFIFYVIPMLNPDGVVAGNFRTSFSGKDLNRQFNKLNKYLYPQITALHDLALQLKRSNRSAFQFYFDFHAHSFKRGLFCYGPEHQLGNPQFFKARALAKLIQQKSPLFSYKKSIFTISQQKKTTGRAHMLWKIKIPMTFTFEVSNGLFENKQARNHPIKISHLHDLGKAVVLGFYRYGQLEMRLPHLNTQAKVDTGIKKKRAGLSVKQFRKSSSKKGKTLTLKEINHLRESYNTHYCRQKRQISLKEINDESYQQRFQSTFEKEQFLKLINEIKRQEMETHQIEDYEGGSDSQSEDEDLEENQLQKLHKIIETRNENSKNYSLGSLQWKSINKKEVFRRQSQSQDIKQNHNPTIQEIVKKPITSKYLQSIKLSALPPRSRRIPVLQAEKIVLAAKNFALEL